MKPDAGNRPRSGLALLRKPEGITSFQALSPVKRALGSGKVGHAGTLDRFARGLLVVLTGSYARLTSYAMSGQKRYRGLIAFGSETDTLDPEGHVIAVAPPPSEKSLIEALPAFRGSIMQSPPAYSAVHVGGKRAYQIALDGGVPGVKERKVEIFELALVSYDGVEAMLDICCSSGTYIRSLARDIAAACGSRAHLRALERSSIGPFRVEDSVDPSAFDPATDLRELRVEEAAALGLRIVELRDRETVTLFRNGGRIDPAAFAVMDAGPSALGSEVAAYGRDGALLGIVRLEAEGPKYLVVLPTGAETISAGETR